jgi:branched-subunit amino acid aminotransferase/4-amino-4-deoxychorismate lyase
MPCYIRILTPQGLQPVPYTADSLADAVRYEPSDGIYTVTNTYHTVQVLKFDAHLDRLEDSARRESIPLRLDRRRLRQGLRQMIAEAGFGDVRFRITVSRQQPDHFILSVEPFKPQPPSI